VDEYLIRPFTSAIAHVAAFCIRMLGTPAHVMRTLIVGPCFSVDIENGCNGVEATLFLLAAVLAFPAPRRSRVLAAIAGSAVIQGANLIRIVTLYLIGCYRREWFETFHLAVWQTVIFAVAMCYFALWTRTVSTDAHRA